MKKHEVIVPFDKKMRVRYMFANREHDDQLAAKNFKLDNICNESKIKKEKLLELCQNIIHRGEKVLVFTKYGNMAQVLLDYFVENGLKENVLMLSLHGRGGKEDIIELLKKINDKKSKEQILFLTDAAMIGTHFSVVTNLIHYDYPSAPNVLRQREGRIGRIGSEQEEKTIYYLMTEDGIDQMHYKRIKKMEQAIEDFTM